MSICYIVYMVNNIDIVGEGRDTYADGDGFPLHIRCCALRMQDSREIPPGQIRFMASEIFFGAFSLHIYHIDIILIEGFNCFFSRDNCFCGYFM